MIETLKQLFIEFFEFINIPKEYEDRIIQTIILFIILYLFEKLFIYLIYKKSNDEMFRYRWKKFTNYIKFTILFLILTKIWFSGFKSIVTFFGLLSAGLAIALKELVANIVGWSFILWKRPFEVGDRIQIGEIAGDVIDIRIFQFTLMEIGNWVDADQSTGRVIHINNGKVFSEQVANYSKGFQFIWDEIGVLLTFESNWRKAKEKFLEIANLHDENLTKEATRKVKKAAKKYMIVYNKLTPIVYTSVKDSGILLTIRYLSDPRKRRMSQQIIWENILDFVNENNDIDFAYPTIRYFNNINEGKKPYKKEN